MRAYSTDLRERIVAALNDGQSYSQVAERFAVSVPTVGRYQRLSKTQNRLSPKPLPGRKPALDKQEQEQLQQLFDSKAGWTIQTLKLAWEEQTSKRISMSCLHRWMQRLELSYKKRVASLPSETLPITANDE